jgi:hypothetical protein
MHQSHEASEQGVVGEISRFCVKGLRPEHHLALAARIHGGSARLAAQLTNYSESQVKRRLDEVKDFVLVPLGLRRHDDLLTGMWVALHQHCCTAPVFSLLESDSRFRSVAS